MKKCFCLILTLILVFTLSACVRPAAPADNQAETGETAVLENTTEETTEESTEEESTAAANPVLRFDFSEGLPEGFRISDGWTNGNMFNVTWRKDNVTFDDGKMQLTIDHEKTAGAEIPYSGAEIQSTDFYGYGRYEVSMKAIKNDGVVSSFFIYTGPSDNNPWDEIDFEILGKDPTKVQLNYFTNGHGNHEFMYDLGYDSSEEFHRYAFEWREGQIDWYVDDVLIHTATANIPVTPAKIMTNAWCGIGVNSWLLPFDDSRLPVTAEYEWITYTEPEK